MSCSLYINHTHLNLAYYFAVADRGSACHSLMMFIQCQSLFNNKRSMLMLIHLHLSICLYVTGLAKSECPAELETVVPYCKCRRYSLGIAVNCELGGRTLQNISVFGDVREVVRSMRISNGTVEHILNNSFSSELVSYFFLIPLSYHSNHMRISWK